MNTIPWYKTRGAILSIAAAFVVGLMIGLSDSPSAGPESSTTGTGEVKPDVSVNEEPASKKEEFQPIKLSGTGQQSTEQFELQRGLYKASLTHDGGGHFGVTVLDENGEWVELLANDVGSFEGSKALRISRSGTFILDVAAGGSWTVEITKQ